MAEDEIIKHTKAVYKTWKDPNRSWLHKLKEILVEVLIIIFAVSVSIWFHNWSEGLKDKKEEKEFLAGLKVDLQGDIVQMTGDMEAYKTVLKGMRYYLNVQNGASKLDKDSILIYRHIFFNTTSLVPNNSRFEALKSSGKLSIIEDKELLKNILDLYQGYIAQISMLNTGYNDYKVNHLGTFLDDNLQFDSAGQPNNIEKILAMPKMHIYLVRGLFAEQNAQQYQATIDKCKEIITEIDKELE